MQQSSLLSHFITKDRVHTEVVEIETFTISYIHLVNGPTDACEKQINCATQLTYLPKKVDVFMCAENKTFPAFNTAITS